MKKLSIGIAYNLFHTTMNSINWSFQIEPSAKEVAELRAGLVEYNVGHSTIADSMDVAIFARALDGGLLGGVTGNLWGGCLEIDFLWVREDQRGQSLGSQILKRLEKEAAARGAKVFFLNTFSFQAPEFYQKQGYEITNIITGYPDGVKKYFFKKALS